MPTNLLNDFCFLSFLFRERFFRGTVEASLVAGRFLITSGSSVTPIVDGIVDSVSPRISIRRRCMRDSASCVARYVSYSPLALVHAPVTPARMLPTHEEKKFLTSEREEVVEDTEGVGVVRPERDWDFCLEWFRLSLVGRGLEKREDEGEPFTSPSAGGGSDGRSVAFAESDITIRNVSR